MQKYLATHSQPDYFCRVNIMIHERSKKIPQGANFLSHHWSNHVAPSPADRVGNSFREWHATLVHLVSSIYMPRTTYLPM